MTFDFFHDFVFVAFEQNELDNVIAICLKLSDDKQKHTLRMIRNDDNHGDFLTKKDIITIVNEKFIIDSTNYE